MGTTSYEGKQVYMWLDAHRDFFVATLTSLIAVGSIHFP